MAAAAAILDFAIGQKFFRKLVPRVGGGVKQAFLKKNGNRLTPVKNLVI